MDGEELRLLLAATKAKKEFLRNPEDPELSADYGFSFARYNKHQALTKRWRKIPSRESELMVIG